MGKWLILAGGVLALVGGLFWLGGKLGIPFGQLPGDIRISGEKFGFYFPIITSLILSVILTIIINIIMSLSRK